MALDDPVAECCPCRAIRRVVRGTTLLAATFEKRELRRRMLEVGCRVRAGDTGALVSAGAQRAAAAGARERRDHLRCPSVVDSQRARKIPLTMLEPAPVCEIAAITRDEDSSTITALLTTARRFAKASGRPRLQAVASA